MAFQAMNHGLEARATSPPRIGAAHNMPGILAFSSPHVPFYFRRVSRRRKPITPENTEYPEIDKPWGLSEALRPG